MSKQVSILSALAIAGLVALEAHKPVADPEHANSASSAVQIENPDVSQVIYHEVTAESPRLWLTFDATKDYELYLSIGVPVIERLKNYRPSLALLGPGLPEVKLPFEIPSGLGGMVFTTDTVTAPELFHEPFTGTDSWILWGGHVRLPATARYYVVAYSAPSEEGKLWVSVGEKERFGFGDIITLPGWISRIRKFHELN